MPNPGRGFRRLHEDDTGFELDRRLDGVQRKRLTVGGTDHVYCATERFGQCRPAFAELAGGEDEDTIAGRRQV